MRRWTWWWRVVVSVRRAVPVPLWLLATLVAPFALEVLWHRSTYAVAVPEHDLDPPFQRGCREPPTDPELVAAGKENAVFVMLARNADIISANHTVTSIERRFNKWFHYPILFLNDEPWDPEFVRVLNATASGGATFEQIPRELWTYPDWIDQDAARESIRRQGNRGIHYAGKESYHHMCRFYSGFVAPPILTQQYAPVPVRPRPCR